MLVTWEPNESLVQSIRHPQAACQALGLTILLMERKRDDDFQQAFIDAKVQNPESFSFITKNEEGYTTDHTAPYLKCLSKYEGVQGRKGAREITAKDPSSPGEVLLLSHSLSFSVLIRAQMVSHS